MRRGVHILRIGMAAVIFVAVLEWCARLDDYISYRAPLLGVYSDANLYENDHLGKRGKPLARYRKWQLNELGYRGPRVESGRMNIVTFGASETFGLYESEDQEYPRQLERELNARAGKPLYQVVNVAYPGQTLPTATRRIVEVVARLHPQVALIYSTPSFYIDLPPKGSGKRVQAEAVPAFEWRIGERLQNVAKSVLPDSVQTWMRAWQIRRWMRTKTAMDRLPEETVVRFRDDLTEMLTALRAEGVEPVVVTHATFFGPSPSNPDRGLLIAWRKFHPKMKEDGFLDVEQRMNQAMREVAAQQHVTLIDIAREVPPGRTYFADFEHFTDAGSALMAKRLADGLQPLLQQPPASAYVSSASTTPQTAHPELVTR